MAEATAPTPAATATPAPVANHPAAAPAATPAAQPQAAPSAHKPFFTSPLGLLIGAIILWFGAAASTSLATYSVLYLPSQDANVRLVLGVLFTVLAVTLTFFALSMLIVGSIRWALFGRSTKGMPYGTQMDQVVALLRTMNARLLLSDTAKRIAYRQEDVNAVRRAIRDDISKGDFDAAMILVTEMATTFGYREESEQYREQITQARAKETERKVAQATKQLDDIINRKDFERASKEAAKLRRLHPDSEAVGLAVRRVVQAREAHKQALEREFLAAAERDDVDRAIQLLHELDRYLTEEEAEPFRETARGVIGKRRDNLGVQFKIAVHDKQWLQALNVGEQIIRDFPNTRMADEVRGMIDLLRERAAGQRAAAPAAGAAR